SPYRAAPRASMSSLLLLGSFLHRALPEEKASISASPEERPPLVVARSPGRAGRRADAALAWPSGLPGEGVARVVHRHPVEGLVADRAAARLKRLVAESHSG